MEREDFYEEERAFEEEVDEWIESCRNEEEEWDEFDRNGFESEADYNRHIYGAANYL